MAWARLGRVGAAFGALVSHATVAAISLSHPEALNVGHRVWQNECGETVSGLTSWNSGEDFASLGIGHFIWYPAGRAGPFEESFPKFLAYARGRGATLPAFAPNDHCPWNSRAEFASAAGSEQMVQLRRFLAGTIDLQADFLVLRLQEALPKMLAVTPASERAAIAKNFERVASSAHGCYALIDYVNFKGEGVLATERYRDRGWGLLQVLEGMPRGVGDGAAPDEFAASAAAVLRARVANAPPPRHEARWLPGWLHRVASYRKS
ncbi:MAG: hypothetical protein H0X40_10265 [Chthoniobacterales bacterium]|nr:hypothetical protein [Chthoniobacterales bacterium]